jgi:hypothetical protein
VVNKEQRQAGGLLTGTRRAAEQRGRPRPSFPK